MAARRVTASAVDWTAFIKKVPKEQASSFNAFKSKSDGYAMRVSNLPASTQAINWASYEGKVSPSLVANFKKQYEAFSVPYPKDTYSAKINEQEKVTMSNVAKFVKESEVTQAKMSAEITRMQSILPIEEMNMEEFFDAYPDEALDTFTKPTMWPHHEDCQPAYLDQMEKDGKFDEAH